MGGCHMGSGPCETYQVIVNAQSHTHPYIPPHQYQIFLHLCYDLLHFIIILFTTTFGYLAINHTSSNNIEHWSRCHKYRSVTVSLLTIRNYHMIITITRRITIAIVGRLITWIFWWRFEEINHQCMQILWIINFNREWWITIYFLNAKEFQE